MENQRILNFNAFVDEYLFRPYDCVRIMLTAYSDITHITPQVCESLGYQLRTGMGYQGTCGAITACLLVMGIMGKTESPDWLTTSFKDACGSCECADIMPVGGRACCLVAIKTAHRLMVEHAAFEMSQDFSMQKAFQGAYAHSKQ